MPCCTVVVQMFVVHQPMVEATLLGLQTNGLCQSTNHRHEPCKRRDGPVNLGTSRDHRLGLDGSNAYVVQACWKLNAFSGVWKHPKTHHNDRLVSKFGSSKESVQLTIFLGWQLFGRLFAVRQDWDCLSRQARPSIRGQKIRLNIV